MTQIVILDGYVLNPGDISWTPIKNHGELTIYDRTTQDQIIERAFSADILLVNKVILNADILTQLPNLKCICITATGYNNVDTITARRLGIDVCNVSNYSTDSVAQHVFALILHLTNHVSFHNQSVKDGTWSRSVDWCYSLASLCELSGLTLGIYGYGAIGQKVASIGRALGMSIIATSRRDLSGNAHKLVKQVEKIEIFRKSDVLSLHVPLTSDTDKLINSDTLSLMKPSAILINTSRGGLVDEEALAKALRAEVIAGAAVDVLSSEPPSNNNPLLSIKNCIITPHNAWATVASRKRLVDGLSDNIDAFKKGRPINLVN